MITRAVEGDLKLLARLGELLWNNHTQEDLKKEFSDAMSGGNTAFFLSYEEDRPVGFAQCSLRYDYVEGAKKSPAGYLEGIFVREEYRNKGYAKALLRECEKWALERNCSDFASDCEIENISSFQFHRNMGFTEVNRIICFAKKL